MADVFGCHLMRDGGCDELVRMVGQVVEHEHLRCVVAAEVVEFVVGVVDVMKRWFVINIEGFVCQSSDGAWLSVGLVPVVDCLIVVQIDGNFGTVHDVLWYHVQAADKTLYDSINVRSYKYQVLA